MATTATLNGGPTGGLHTTPTLIHSEEPPQDETCRVESNSSFESGHEELQTVLPLDQGETSSWVCGGDVGKSSESHSFFMESHNSTNSLLEAKGKKRRKQSRPIRIPASELMDLGATTGATIAAAAAMDTLEAGELPLPCFRRTIHDESEEHGESQAHSHHHHQHIHRKHVVTKGHSQGPLNLSKNEQHHAFSEEQRQQQQQHHHLHHPHMDCQQPISSSLEPVQTNSSIENDKTELAGQGTKDSFSTCNPITSSGSPPNPLPPSFSPGLFPLSSSSPFSALFPSAVGFFSQHQQLSQQQQQTSNTTTANQHHRSSTTPNPPSGTPTSSSSAGSNHLGGSSHQNVPPHRIFNPEAYCDLCNKEFCNKYFLKTHKANKHGVYSELPQSLGMNQSISSSSPSSSYLTTPVLSVIPSLQQQQQQQQSQQQQQQSSQTALVSVPLSSASSKGGGLGSGTEIPFSVSFSMEKSGNSNGSQQRESFCELCQKEFCNKYFLKKHKAKIHGIPMESSSRSSSSGRSQRDSFSNGVTEKRSGEGSCCGISGSGLATLRDIKLETLGLEMVSKHMEDSCGVGGVGVDDGRGEEGELGHSDESRTGMNLVSGGQCELSAPGNVDMNKSPENTRDSDENSSFKISSLELKLPQLGAVNAENTCQFCFRDFASKNLLRSHLVKKHRLLLPSFPPFLLPFGNMPSLFDDGAESAGTNLDNNGNATEIDHECNLCNRTFQTIYLLRMHKSYFHPDSEEAADPETSKLITEAANLLGVKSADEAEPGLASDPESGKNTPNENENGGSKSRKIRSAVHHLSAVEMENRGEGTSDSDDLRRLQTMIMELNRVSSASVAAWSPPLDTSISPAPLSSTNSSTLCHICSKEFYSTYFLQQHIQHYHTSPAGVAADSGIQIKTESPNEITSTTTVTNNNNNTPTPGKKGSNSLTSGESRELPSNIVQGALKERLLHPSESLALELGSAGNLFLTPGPKGTANPGVNTPNNNNGANNKNNDANSAAANNAKRPSPSLSRSYCTICHKELCNKYFMRTHMLKMHGISIESSTGLGGVTCDICNKELCSKYFLKVHKQNTHGIVDEGPSPPNPSTPGPIGLSATFPMASTNTGGLNLSTALSEVSVPVSQPDAVPLLPNNQLDLTNRYFCHYSEVCPFCGRRFRSAKWLKTHLLADHGQEGRDRWKSIEKTLSPSRRQSKVGKGSASGSTKMGSGGSSGSNKATSSHKNVSNSRDANKCALCGFSTPDMESMKVHLIKEHGNQLASGQAALVGDAVSGFQDGQRGVVLDPLTMLFQKMEGGTNKMYRCAYCPFTTSLLVYLYAHERTHTGLATSVTSPASTSTQDTSATFQCPMCFHTFQQAEAFQQHLIGHQMSGVLAPFFTPTTSASGRLAFLATPPGSDPSSDQAALLSLPLLNGNSGDNLYWALKNASNGKSNGESPKSSAHHAKHSGKDTEGGGEEEDDEEEDEEDETEPPVHRKTCPADMRTENENISGEMVKPRKRGRISHFRCSHCQVAFKSREECAAHIQQTHTSSKQPKSRRKKSFRCRKCKFFSSTYHMLLVHSRIHHSILRDSHLQRGKMERSWKMKNLPEGRGIPQEGVGDGEFVMQGFLLTSSEEESSNQSGYFVPSLVYLPVREKVSQSIRVSFSLTPTS